MSLDYFYLRMIYGDIKHGSKQSKNTDSQNETNQASLIKISITYGVPIGEIVQDIRLFNRLESITEMSIDELINKQETLTAIKSRLNSHDPKLISDVRQALFNENRIAKRPPKPVPKTVKRNKSHPLQRPVWDICKQYMAQHGKFPSFKALMNRLEAVQHDLAYADLCIEVTDDHIQYFNPFTRKTPRPLKHKSLENRYSEWKKELIPLSETNPDNKAFTKH